MKRTDTKTLQQIFEARYGDAARLNTANVDGDMIRSMAQRGSCRDFLDTPVSDALVDVLCAAALASPTKSDLQQRDIIVLKSPDQRHRLSALVAGQSWVADAPMIAVFCGNNRRQRLIHDWHGIPFANDHLDAFFNATTDAAIALGAFVTAADAVGLGCCPISAVRNRPEAVSALLDLPDHVFPLAGLAIGYPCQSATIAKRLPLRVTCHTDRYRESTLQETVRTYDDDRRASQPYAQQRHPETFGQSTTYGWSENKVRQYSQAERADFGAYVRAIGFRLD